MTHRLDLFLSSDYYRLDELLTKDEKSLRVKVRQFMEKEVAPIVPKFCVPTESFNKFSMSTVVVNIIGACILMLICLSLPNSTRRRQNFHLI